VLVLVLVLANANANANDEYDRRPRREASRNTRHDGNRPRWVDSRGRQPSTMW